MGPWGRREGGRVGGDVGKSKGAWVVREVGGGYARG